MTPMATPPTRSSRERILQSGDAVEHGLVGPVIHPIGHKVAVAFKLEAAVGGHAAQPGLHKALDHLTAVGVQLGAEIGVVGTGLIGRLGCRRRAPGSSAVVTSEPKSAP